jgi:hypothetical protein
MSFKLSIAATARLLGSNPSTIRWRALHGRLGLIEQHGEGATILNDLGEITKRFGHFTDAQLVAALNPPPKVRKPYQRRARR